AEAKVESGLAAYPEDPTLLKLQHAIRTERAEEERRIAIRQAVDEATAHANNERWDQAIATIEKARRQYPNQPELQGALDRIEKARERQREQARLAAFENDLRRAQSMLDQGQAGQATQLLERLTVVFPNEPKVEALRHRAQAERERLEEQERERLEAER